jgi:hypothetical protein
MQALVGFVNQELPNATPYEVPELRQTGRRFGSPNGVKSKDKQGSILRLRTSRSLAFLLSTRFWTAGQAFQDRTAGDLRLV